MNPYTPPTSDPDSERKRIKTSTSQLVWAVFSVTWGVCGLVAFICCVVFTRILDGSFVAIFRFSYRDVYDGSLIISLTVGIIVATGVFAGEVSRSFKVRIVSIILALAILGSVSLAYGTISDSAPSSTRLFGIGIFIALTVAAPTILAPWNGRQVLFVSMSHLLFFSGYLFSLITN